MIKENWYTTFGVIEEDTNLSLYMPIGFAGGLHDRDIGWVRFGYRDYDPLTARFTAKDPLGYAAGDSDLRGYCFDDPVNGIDPEGLEVGDFWDIPANFNRVNEIAEEELAKRPGHNSKGDAMRHAEWSRRVSEEVGPITSWAAGTEHEAFNLLQGEPWKEIMMDLHNNSEGRAAASEGRSVDPEKLQGKPKKGVQVNPYDPSQYWFEKK